MNPTFPIPTEIRRSLQILKYTASKGIGDKLIAVISTSDFAQFLEAVKEKTLPVYLFDSGVPCCLEFKDEIMGVECKVVVDYRPI